MSPFLFFYALWIFFATSFVSVEAAPFHLLGFIEGAGSSSSTTTSSSTSTAAAKSTTSASPIETTSTSNPTSTTAQSTASATSSTTSITTSSAKPTSANISPLGSSTDIFTVGKACKASWTPAVSGSTTWSNMSIDLMTGSNLNMTRLATVAGGLDGTNSNVISYEYLCPDVTPNAPIYFLQYTHDGGKDPMWTTRFTIARSNGIWMNATEANQPQGGNPAIHWGTGALVTNSSNKATTSSKNSDSTAESGSLSVYQNLALSMALPAVVVAVAFLL